MAIAKIISLALLLWAAKADMGVDTCEEDGGCEEVGLAQLRAVARRQAESGEGDANKEHTMAPARDAPMGEGEANAVVGGGGGMGGGGSFVKKENTTVACLPFMGPCYCQMDTECEYGFFCDGNPGCCQICTVPWVCADVCP